MNYNVDPTHCGDQGSQHYPPEALVQHISDSIWAELDATHIKQCSTAELNLIRHHIRSAIEEGIKRAQIQAEREIELILNKCLNEACSE